jgi:hypothetical protein
VYVTVLIVVLLAICAPMIAQDWWRGARHAG